MDDFSDVRISDSTYEFTVKAGGDMYDVYWFRKNSKVGQLAFRQRIDGKYEIVLMRVGRKSIEEVLHEILHAKNGNSKA